MDHSDKEPSMTISNSYSFSNGPSLNHSAWFEIRLFYVRIAPCVTESVPSHLTLRHLRREIGISLEINNFRIPAAESSSIDLRRDRLDKETSEVTYVSTDSVRVTGGVEFEVYENKDLILCGSLERMDPIGAAMGVLDWKTSRGPGGVWIVTWQLRLGQVLQRFFNRSLGFRRRLSRFISPGVALGCHHLTKTIQISPKRKAVRHAVLDAIPEDEEIGKEQRSVNGLIRNQKVQITESEIDDYESDGKIGHGFYSEDMYSSEDGQLTWFNAGVRVGVGIGLGMCVGIGIGVGLLMRSYQATTRNFRRRFS